MALKVPIFIVVSKVDLCSSGTVERTVRQLERVLKQPGCSKVPLVVSSPDDAVTAAQQFTQTTWWVARARARLSTAGPCWAGVGGAVRTLSAT